MDTLYVLIGGERKITYHMPEIVFPLTHLSWEMRARRRRVFPLSLSPRAQIPWENMVPPLQGKGAGGDVV